MKIHEVIVTESVKPVIDMMDIGDLHVAQILEENDNFLESYAPWQEIQPFLSRLTSDTPEIGAQYSVMNLIVIPPAKSILQLGHQTPLKLNRIIDRGNFKQFEFESHDRMILYPDEYYAGDKLSKTFFYRNPEDLQKTLTLTSVSLPADWKIRDRLSENFKDGKNPGRKGLAKRMGVNTKASVSSLRRTAKNSSGEKARMAHWLANMKSGKKKK